MVDTSKPAGVKGLAAMFEQNASQVSAPPLQRRQTQKLKSNPFESNAQAAASASTVNLATATARKSVITKLNNPFEQNIQAAAQAPPLKKPAPKQAPVATPVVKPTPTPTPTPAAKPTPTPVVKPTPAPVAKPTLTPAAKPTPVATTVAPQVAPKVQPAPKKLATATFEQNNTPSLAVPAKPAAAPRKSLMANNPFEQNIQAAAQAPPLKKPAPKIVPKPLSTPETPSLPNSSSEVATKANTSASLVAEQPVIPAKRPSKLSTNFFEQQIAESKQPPAFAKKAAPIKPTPKPAAIVKKQESIEEQSPFSNSNSQVSEAPIKPPVSQPVPVPKLAEKTAAPVVSTANTILAATAKAANLRKKLGGFQPKERTPSPPKERATKAGAKKIQMSVFQMDDDSEDEKQDQPVKKPIKKLQANNDEEENKPDDFKAKLAAMLMRGPSATVAKKPPPVRQNWDTAEDIFEAKLNMPKMRERANTKRYDVGKYDFDGF